MAYFSPEESFERLKQHTTEVVKGYFPVEGDKHLLRVKNVWVDDDKHIDDIRSQKESRVSGRTWAVPVKAQLELVDKKTNKVIDSSEQTILQLPKVTRRHSFIVDGNEWQIANQFRLKSGVYTRIKENGELESQWNLKKGKGFRMGFDPRTKRLHMKYGEARVPLYPVLKALGVDDDEIERRWGKDVLSENMKGGDEKTLRQLYRSMIGDTVPADLAQVRSAVVEQFNKTELRPDSTQITLGSPFDKVSGAALLHGAEKILKVSRQEVEPDDRDGLQFKDFYSAEDLLRERLEKDSRRDITRRLTNKIDKTTKLREMIHPDIFGRAVKSFFTNTAISERPTQTNPLNFLGGARKTTIGGEHGIDDPHKITLEAKMIHPSHLGFLDPVQTPESERIGTVLQMASGSKKVGKEIHTSVYNIKTGKLDWIDPAKALSSNVAFPDQYRWDGSKPSPLHKDVKIVDREGKMTVVKPEHVDYVLRSSKGMFDLSANLIPFLQNDQGNRTMVAAKQLEQAVPLVHREAPLVQTKGVASGTFENALGRFNSHEAPVAGTVHSVGADHIIIKDAAGKKHEIQLYDHFPLNDNKALIHSTALVAKGDTVKAGQLIADTNFTRGGKLALGTNLRVAYIPYKGYNYDDGIVISESAAEKLTSEHMHREGHKVDENSILSKAKFLAHTAGQVTKDQAAKLDEHAVIKVGSIVAPGDVLLGILRKEEHTQEQKALSLFSKKTLNPVSARPIHWDKEYPGVVTGVVRSGRETTVYVKAQTPAQVGDKLAGRHGNKGVITKILPNHEMPHTEDGTHMEILLNPTGVPTRINLGQVLETVAGKLAAKAGRTYVVDNFDPEVPDYTKHLTEELKKHGISDKEGLVDPTTNKRLGDALVGLQHILKLHHTAEKGIVARSRGGYDVNMTPKHGGSTGGQTLDISGMYALLAHGARENIREAQTIKSDMNDDFWTALQAGESVPAPRTPFVYKKFEGYLRAIGVNVVKDGNAMHLVPITDKQVLAMSNGELTAPDKMIRAKDLKPEAGGLFDPKVTGTLFPDGKLGDRWSHFTLAQRMPNPIFEKPVQVLLGLKGDDLQRVIAGEKELDGKYGPTAITEKLSKVNVRKDLAQLEGALPKMRKSDLSDATKKIKFLRALDKHDLHPLDAYTMQQLPVLPPAMRPISVMQNGDLNEADQNGLYKNIAETNHQLKTFDEKIMPPEEKHGLHTELYDGLKALMLTGSTNRGRHRRGILDIIARGKNEGPKAGYFQDKVIGRRQDLSMRGVIVPEPSLGLNEAAIPRKAAEEIYKPFVVRRLVRAGYTPLQAQQEVKKGTSSAHSALEAEVKERPLLLKRDPVLHKFGVQAFMPVLTTGNAIKIHPLATSGYNADFDGDKMSAYVPVSQKAVQEAFDMLPSKNLFNPSDGKLIFTPSQESMLGLFKLSIFGKTTSHRFKTAGDAAVALKEGKIGMHDIIHVDDPHTLIKQADTTRAPHAVKTTVGRLMLQHGIPDGALPGDFLSDGKYELTKKNLHALLTKVAKGHDGDTFARTADFLKNIGNEYATGYSFGLEDLHAHSKSRDEILHVAQEQEKKIRSGKHTQKEKDDQIVALYTHAGEQIEKKIKPVIDASSNKLYDWVRSGARGNWDQYKQMVIGPMLVVDSSGRKIPAPITKSYSEGLDTGSYWASLYGARMGTIGRVEGTEIPGSQTKQMIQTSLNQLVTADDCGTTKGLAFHVDDNSILDRYTATDIDLGERGGKEKGKIPAGSLITPDIVARLRNNRVKDVPVRTPLKCQEHHGLCAKCFGLSERGGLHPKGTNIGVMAVHALGEPMTQMAMNAFHEGGVAGARGSMAVDKITRLRQLTELPEKLPGAATLSKISGKVDQVEEDKSTGGWHIHVGGEKHYIPGRRDLLVKKGDEVRKGDPLSDGPINPRELLPLTNLSAVQRYIADELQKVYGSTSNLHRRNTEVFVRALTNLSLVTDAGEHPEFMRGDRVATSQIQAYNAKVPPGKKPVAYTPVLKGTNNLPLDMQSDWLARLQHRDLTRTIQDGAAEGWISNIHGTHPIPGMAFGAEFGKGTPDAPWLY